MIKVGIAIDTCKLDVFDEVLTKAGYSYTKLRGMTADTLLLMVECDDIDVLAKHVLAAQDKYRKSRMI